MSKTDVKKSREASGILTLQVNLRERRNFLNLMQNKLFFLENKIFGNKR